jgi:hypothetical protein
MPSVETRRQWGENDRKPEKIGRNPETLSHPRRIFVASALRTTGLNADNAKNEE